MILIDVLNILFYILKDLTMCGALVMACLYLLGGTFRKSTPGIVLFCLTYILAAVIGVKFILGTAEDADALMDAVSLFITIPAVFFFVRDVKNSKKLLVMLICGFTADMLFSLLAGYLPDYLFAECIMNIVLYALIIAAAGYAMKSSEGRMMPQVFNVIPRWIIFALLIFDITCYYKQFGISEDWYNVLYIISSMGIIVCVLYFIAKIFTLTYQQNLILKQFHEQKEYSEKMLTGDEDLRKFRHDYKNHMIVINALLENGETDRARAYLNAMNSNLISTLTRISTGNFVADSILNNKAVVAAEYDSEIKFSGQFPSNGIADDDLCTVLANVIDNAIEAVKAIENGKKQIKVEAAVRNSMFILSVSNPVNDTVRIGKSNLLKTTKKNKAEHGYGMKNVQKAVRKYAGSMDISCENKIFTVNIRMKPKE